MIAIANNPEQNINVSRVIAKAGAISLHIVIFLLVLIPIQTEFGDRLIEVPEPMRQEAVLVELIKVPPRKNPTPPARPAPFAAPVQVDSPMPIPAPSMDVAQIDSDMPLFESIESPVSGSSGGASHGLGLLDTPAPRYPREALKARQQGLVELLVRIDRNGSPVEVRVTRSSGYSILDRAARTQVLNHWRFAAPVLNGLSQETWVAVPVSFEIR